MPNQLHHQDCRFTQTADTVTLGNSRIERTWRFGPKGLTTVSLVDRLTSREWALKDTSESVITTQNALIALSRVPVESVSAEVVQTPISEACIRLEFMLTAGDLAIRKYFDVFPEVPAIRAFIELTSDSNRSNLDYTQVESLALDLSDAHATAVELHDLTDVTNHLATVRKHDLRDPRDLVGNNVFIETRAGDGVFGYKESPVPNSQLYHLYYDFRAGESSLAGVGAGFHNLPAGQTRRTYAFTIGVYSRGRDHGILALKQYQQSRYKLVPERDYVVAANSWGAFGVNINESILLAEVEAAAELGIESVAVDAGWTQHVMGGEPDPEKFPNGFGPLTRRAKELGVKLELWMVPNRLHDSLEVLKEHPNWIARTNNLTPCDSYHSYWDTHLLGIELCNPECFAWMKDYFLGFYDQGFERFKMDTFQCDRYDSRIGDTHDHYEALRRLMHELTVERPGLTFTQDSTRTNRPIYDYYMDYGIIFLENRYRRLAPESNGRYLPWKTLRNLWQIAPYIPPSKISMELTNDEEGYSAEYLLGTVMMANPLFWESLAQVSEESKRSLAPAIALYKRHRQTIYSGQVFPLGDMPDATAWTGFQSHDPKTNSGYLIAYRENNPSDTHTFHPKFISGPTQFESITDDTPSFTLERPEDGLEVKLPAPRSFRLYRYRR